MSIAVESLVFDSMPDALVVTDPVGVICRWSAGATRLLDYTAQEAIGRKISEFPPRPAAPATGTESVGASRIVLRKNGTAVKVEWRAVPLRADNSLTGHSLHVLRTCAHPTGEAEEDDGARANENRVVALRAAHVGIWELDLGTGVQTWDDEMFQIYGITERPAVCGCDLWKHTILPADYPRIEREIGEAFRDGGRPFNTEYRIRHTMDGEPRTIRAIATIIRDGEGRPLRMVGVNWDVSDLRRVERECRQMYDQLCQRQKVELLGTLAGGIAHDLNNFLAPILVWADLLLQDTAGASDEVRDRVDKVRRAATSARDLVRRILAFSRFEPLELHLIRLEDVVEQTVPLLRASLPLNVRMAVEVPGKLPAVHADAIQMQQLLLNLASNAVHAMRSDGGKLTIRVNARRFSDWKSGTGRVLSGTYVVLEVEDTGAGVEPELLHRIFEPFFTTKPSGDGVGLGLSIVRGIAETHGGFMDVASTVGKGSTFSLLLPIAVEPESGDGCAARGRSGGGAAPAQRSCER